MVYSMWHILRKMKKRKVDKLLDRLKTYGLAHLNINES